MNRLKGIIPPLITPLLDRDALDHKGLERLLEHVIKGGVHGLFILGTTGEAPSLSYARRRELITQVCTLTKNRVPVLVGVTDTAFTETVALAQHAADAGADALVLTTPYYFPAGQTELTDYIQHLLPELPLPLVLYNMPALTKVPFEIETLRRLSEFDQIIGVKDSSGDLDYFQNLIALREHRPDWTFLIGPEHLLIESIRLGGDGGVNGGANVFPKLFVDAYHAAQVNDPSAIAALQQKIDAWQHVYDIGKYASRHIKATKCALSLLNICNDFMAEPFHKFKNPERQKVQALLENLQSIP